MRLSALLLALIFSAAAFSQSSVPISGLVPDTRVRTFLYQLDLGPVATSYTVTANIYTSSPSGLRARLINLDGFAGDASETSTFVDAQQLSGSGTANCALSGTANGIVSFALELTTDGGGTTNFSGSVNSTAGLLDFRFDDQYVIGSPGLHLQVNHLAAYSRNVPSGLSAQGIELDFGGVPQTLPVRFEAVGSNLIKIDVYDNTGGSADLIATFTGSGGLIDDVTVIVLNHHGLAHLRVNVVGGSGGGTVAWRIAAPSEIELGMPGANGGTVDESDSCTTGSRMNYWPALIGILALMALASRMIRRA